MAIAASDAASATVDLPRIMLSPLRTPCLCGIGAEASASSARAANHAPPVCKQTVSAIASVVGNTDVRRIGAGAHSIAVASCDPRKLVHAFFGGVLQAGQQQNAHQFLPGE